MKLNIFHITALCAMAVAMIMPASIFGKTADGTDGSQAPILGKLSPQLRVLLNTHNDKGKTRRQTTEKGAVPVSDTSATATVCAFVRTGEASDTTILKEEGCRVLASLGDITIAAIPLDRVAPLSRRSCVRRIEAQRGSSLSLDSLGIPLNVPAVHKGANLPQAYDGSGVVVGMQDVGFDLTNPTFLGDDAKTWRIRSFWDQLAEGGDGRLFVGADYTDETSLRAVAHSRDASLIPHGTMTTSIAAGTGFGSPYRGMAPGSDICLVSNAVNIDAPLIREEDLYKYTYATDVLGFKYIFDYAASKGQPCVINFSEGSAQDFRGDDVLYFEALRRLTGPGRILVSAAGNNSVGRTYFRKPSGTGSDGVFIRRWGKTVSATMKSTRHFTLRLTGYDNHFDGQRSKLLIDTRDIVAAKDSSVTDTLRYADYKLAVDIKAFPSCYDEGETAYDVTVSGANMVGTGSHALSVETVGGDADVEFFCLSGEIYDNSLDPSLHAGDNTHNINSPAAAPSVICVGATAHRRCLTNFKGDKIMTGTKTPGEIAYYSSIGPTFAGLTKPDVVAPGSNVISAFSSYYIEADPSRLTNQTISTFEHEGRTYAWYYEHGTSLSSPAVAGIIALWLQAVPTLSPEDVMEVIAATSRHNDPSLSYPNNIYGYGEIDTHRGLLHLLKLDSVEGISTDQSAARITVEHGNTLKVNLPRTASLPFSIGVYSVGGQLMQVARFTPGKDCYTMPLGKLPNGVYAVQINSGDTALGGSVLVRLK